MGDIKRFSSFLRLCRSRDVMPKFWSRIRTQRPKIHTCNCIWSIHRTWNWFFVGPLFLLDYSLWLLKKLKKGYIKLVRMDVTVKGRRGRPHIMYIFLLWILSQVDCLVYLIGCHVHCRQKCIAMKLYYYFNTICMRRLKNKTLRLWHIRIWRWWAN